MRHALGLDLLEREAPYWSPTHNRALELIREHGLPQLWLDLIARHLELYPDDQEPEQWAARVLPTALMISCDCPDCQTAAKEYLSRTKWRLPYHTFEIPGGTHDVAKVVELVSFLKKVRPLYHDIYVFSYTWCRYLTPETTRQSSIRTIRKALERILPDSVRIHMLDIYQLHRERLVSTVYRNQPTRFRGNLYRPSARKRRADRAERYRTQRRDRREEEVRKRWQDYFAESYPQALPDDGDWHFAPGTCDGHPIVIGLDLWYAGRVRMAVIPRGNHPFLKGFVVEFLGEEFGKLYSDRTVEAEHAIRALGFTGLWGIFLPKSPARGGTVMLRSEGASGDFPRVVINLPIAHPRYSFMSLEVEADWCDWACMLTHLQCDMQSAIV